MYSIKAEDWAKYTDINHEQKYFIYLWSYLLSSTNNSLELERLPVIGLRGMLEEILELFTLCDEEIINRNNLNNLAEEIRLLLNGDLVIKKYYKEDYNTIQDILQKIKDSKQNDIRYAKEILSSFLKKLDKEYYKYTIETINLKLQQSNFSYKQIDKLAEQLLSDFLFQGYSKTYLFNKGIEIFIHGTESNFISRLNRFIELGNQKTKDFTCIFILKIPEKMLKIKTNQELVFYSSKEELVENNDVDNRFIDDFPELKARQVYAMVRTKVMDRYSAINKSYLKLVNIVKLNCIFKPNYKPLIANKVLVFNDFGCWLRKNETKLLNIEMENNLYNFIEKYIGENTNEYNQNTLESLRNALHWVRIANESPLESKFLSLWTALESLLTPHPKKKLTSILEYVPAFIGV